MTYQRCLRLSILVGIAWVDGILATGQVPAPDGRTGIDLIELAPGEYLLTMEASRESTTVQRAVRFTVR